MPEETSADDVAIAKLAEQGLVGTVQQSDDDGFLPFDPADQAASQSTELERDFASKELLDLLNRVERDVKSWIPVNIGDSLFGTVVDTTWVENDSNDYDPYWMITVETPSGKLLAFHAYHTAIAKNVAQKKESGELAKGSQIAISYRGEAAAKGKKSGAKLYNMALISPV